jgi:hypothetical protein
VGRRSIYAYVRGASLISRTRSDKRFKPLPADPVSAPRYAPHAHLRPLIATPRPRATARAREGIDRGGIAFDSTVSLKGAQG